MTKFIRITTALAITLLILVLNVQQISSSNGDMLFLPSFILRPDFASTFLDGNNQQQLHHSTPKTNAAYDCEEDFRELGRGGRGD